MVRPAAAALLAAALLLPACRKEEAPAAKEEAAEEIPGEEVRLLRAFPPASAGGFPAPERAVIRDAAAWAAAWAKGGAGQVPAPKEPAVDFAKEMVALAALGPKPTGGWSVEIVGARKDGGRLRLLVAERGPAPGSMATQALTCPWHAVVLPASDLPVEWSPYVPPGAKPAGK